MLPYRVKASPSEIANGYGAYLGTCGICKTPLYVPVDPKEPLVYADLDGDPWESYYCQKCVLSLSSSALKGTEDS